MKHGKARARKFILIAVIGGVGALLSLSMAGPTGIVREMRKVIPGEAIPGGCGSTAVGPIYTPDDPMSLFPSSEVSRANQLFPMWAKLEVVHNGAEALSLVDVANVFGRPDKGEEYLTLSSEQLKIIAYQVKSHRSNPKDDSLYRSAFHPATDTGFTHDTSLVRFSWYGDRDGRRGPHISLWVRRRDKGIVGWSWNNGLEGAHYCQRDVNGRRFV